MSDHRVLHRGLQRGTSRSKQVPQVEEGNVGGGLWNKTRLQSRGGGDRESQWSDLWPTNQSLANYESQLTKVTVLSSPNYIKEYFMCF